MKQKKYGKKIARGVILIVYTMMSYASQPPTNISPVAKLSLFEPGSDVAPFVQQRFADSNTGAAAKKLYKERQDRMYSPGQQTIVQAPTPSVVPAMRKGVYSSVSARDVDLLQNRDQKTNQESIYNPFVEFIIPRKAGQLLPPFTGPQDNSGIFKLSPEPRFPSRYISQIDLPRLKELQQHNENSKPLFKELKGKTRKKAEDRAFLASLSQYLSDENPSSALPAVEQQTTFSPDTKSSEQSKTLGNHQDVIDALSDLSDENPSSPSAAVKQQSKSSEAKYPDLISALDHLYFGPFM